MVLEPVGASRRRAVQVSASANSSQIELLELTEGAVRVASYLTELPPRELLERKLLESIEHARATSAEALKEADREG